MTLRVPLPGIARLETYSGCAYTCPVTGYENSLPNVAVLTLDVVSATSLVFSPWRVRSLCHVSTLTDNNWRDSSRSTNGRSPAATRRVPIAPLGRVNFT